MKKEEEVYKDPYKSRSDDGSLFTETDLEERDDDFSDDNSYDLSEGMPVENRS